MKNFILIYLFSATYGLPYDLDPTVLADVISVSERQLFVIAKICWPASDKLKLYQAILKKDSRVFVSEYGGTDEGLNNDGQEHRTVFLVNLACPDIIDYLHMSTARGFFRGPYRWILFGNSATEEIVPAAVSDKDVHIDSEVIVIRRRSAALYDLHLIYRINASDHWITEFYGSWDAKDKFKRSEQFNEITSSRRLNLDGYEIKACYVLTNNDSLNHLADNIDDHIDTITKVNFPTTNHLLDFLNARRKYVFADTWGYRVNGTWNGMTGYLVRGEVEIGGSPMFFTQERVSIVDYISSPTPTRSKFVFQQPKLSYENNLFILPFQSTLWYCTGALICLICLVLFIVAMWEWKKKERDVEEREKDASILRANIVDIIVLMFGAACQQGSHCELKGSLGRIVMLVLFLALMFLYTSYSANIVALLQSSSTHIKTLDDLLHSRIKFGVHDTVFNRYYFSTSTEPVRKAIYDKKVAPPGSPPRFMSMEEGVKKMQKGLFAFHMETGVGYKFVGKYFNEGEKCGLQEIQYLQVIDPWMAVRKGTPFKELFKIGTKRIQEHGLQYRENHLMYKRRPTCSGGGSNFISVGMVDCYPALLILSFGAVLALIILVFEILVHRRQELMKIINCTI